MALRDRVGRMGHRNRTVLLFATVVLMASATAGAADAVMRPAVTVDKDTSWEGKVRVERSVTVRRGATLTVKPGAEVVFARGAGLTAEGVLVAKGSAKAPVRFVSEAESPSAGEWEGIRFTESSAGSILSHCLILGAAAVDVSGQRIEIVNCEIGKGKAGLIIRRRSRPVVTGNTILEMSEGGIHCAQESSPRIEKNVLRSCGPFGILSDRSAAPVVRENEIADCERGLVFTGVIPPVEGNVLRENGVGLSSLTSGNLQVIRGNRFEGNETGLLCEQYSEPRIEGNSFSGNAAGLVCYRSSSPRILNNEFSGNEIGIICRQFCRPRIIANEIRGNGKGIFLTLSSYAVVNGNNIHGNEVQMELGLMSSDWERKTAGKPLRGSAAQQANQASRGIASSPPGDGGKEEEAVKASVDATGNWWGEKDTGEMERNGPEANIGGLVDYYDAPVHPSEGYPGLFEQDRIRYEGWRKSRVPDAGLPPGPGS